MPSEGGGLPPQAPDGLRLPYQLRPRAWALAPLVVAAAAFTMAFVILEHRAPGPLIAHAPGLALALAPPVLVAGAAFAQMLRPVATLYPDRIEARQLLGRRVLRRQDIQGFRTSALGRDARLQLVSSRPGDGGLSLPLWTRNDPTMSAWLAGAPDIGAQARQAHRERVLADPRFGATPQDRAARLALAKGLGIGLIIAGLAMAAWLLARPLDLVSLVSAFMALLAGLALSVTMDGLFGWLPMGDGRAPLAGAAIPLAALFARAAFTTHLVRVEPMIGFGVLCAVVAGGLALTRTNDPLQRGRLAIGAAVAGGVMGYGALTALDIGPDRSAGTVSEATVIGRRVSHGRSSTWYLTLSPSPDGGEGEVSVSPRLWKQMSNGDLACVTRHPGAVGVAWFTVESCARLRT